MNGKSWREIAEMAGVFGIIAGLLLVAWEIRQASQIAKAQTVMALATEYNEFNSARFQDPGVAQLARMLMRPQDFELTDADRSRIAGAAWHFANILWSAQVAYDNGLLEMDELVMYRSHLEWMIVHMPGLHEEFLLMYETSPAVQSEPVFEPLRKLAQQTGHTE